MYDLIIIGAGPAGMTAAVYAARKRLKAMLLTLDIGGQVLWTQDVENYMGYQYITGAELMAKFEAQMRQYPLEIHYEKADRLEKKDGLFQVVSDAGKVYTAKTVILASGKKPRLLEVPGEQEFVGLGVSYCATCDGPLFAGKKVAVIGGGNSAFSAVLEMARIAEEVILISNSRYIADAVLQEKAEALTNLKRYLPYEVRAIHGNTLVNSITVQHKETRAEEQIAVDGVFVEIGLAPNAELAEGLVKRNAVGEVITDCTAGTNVPGLFAAGDVTSGPDKQIVIAAGDGAKAALSAFQFLLNNNIVAADET